MCYQTSDNMDRWKSRVGRVREREKVRRKKMRRRAAKHISKSKCTKHHMFGPLLEVAMLKKCMPLWREAHLEVKMHKTPQCRSTFWKFKCRKSARHCCGKHISKSKCAKHTMLGLLLEVDVEKVHAVLARSKFLKSKV